MERDRPRRQKRLRLDGEGTAGAGAPIPARGASDGDVVTARDTFATMELGLRCGSVTVPDLRRWLDRWCQKEDARRHNETGWAALPPELLAGVFSALSTLRDMRACSETCASWNATIWRFAAKLPSCSIGCHQIRDVIKHCPRLEALDCFFLDMRRTDLLTQLTSLNDLQLELLTRGPDSRSVNSVLLRLTGLTSLVLAKQSFDDLEWPALWRLTRLRRLEMRELPPWTFTTDNRRLALPTTLWDLSLALWRAVEAESVACLPGLTSLAVDKGVSLIDWTGISRLTTLRKLSFYPDEFAALGDTLARMPNLTSLLVRSLDGQPFACPPGLVELRGGVPFDFIVNFDELTALRVLETGGPWPVPCPTTLTHLKLGWGGSEPGFDWNLLRPLQKLVQLTLTDPYLPGLVDNAFVLHELPCLTAVKILGTPDDDLLGVLRSSFRTISFALQLQPEALWF